MVPPPLRPQLVVSLVLHQRGVSLAQPPLRPHWAAVSLVLHQPRLPQAVGCLARRPPAAQPSASPAARQRVRPQCQSVSI